MYPLEGQTLLAEGFSREEIRDANEVFASWYRHVPDPATIETIFKAASPTAEWRAQEGAYSQPTDTQANNLMLIEGQNPVKVITQSEKMRASIGINMSWQAIPDEALNARTVDALSADPVYKIGTRGMGGNGTVTR